MARTTEDIMDDIAALKAEIDFDGYLPDRREPSAAIAVLCGLMLEWIEEVEGMI